MLPGWCCIANRHIGARERRQLIPPHVRFQVPFLGPESELKSGFACAGLLCKAKTRKATEEGNKNQQQPKANTNPQHHRTPQGTHTDQTTPDTQGQTEQAETNNRPEDTGPAHHPKRDNEKGEHPRDKRQRSTRQPRRKEAKSKSKTEWHELRGTSAPAQSADKHTSTKRIET